MWLILLIGACGPGAADGKSPPAQCAAPAAALRYADVGAAWGLLDTADGDRFGHDNGAVAMADFDLDGDDDVLISHRTDGVWYQENLGGRLGMRLALELEDVAFIAVGDIDNDGDLDWIAGGGLPQIAVMENDGQGGFTDVSAASGINAPWVTRPKRHGAFADFDGDGWLDLFLTTSGDIPAAYRDLSPDGGKRHQLFRNTGGRFGNVTDLLPAQGTHSAGWSAVWTDYDVDGDPDLYVAHSDQELWGPSALFENRGADPGDPDGWRFRQATDGCYCGETGPTMGVAAGDFDNDGWPDLSVNATGPEHLLQNMQDGTFLDVTAAQDAWGTDNARVMSFGNIFADLDNDRWLDTFLSTGPLLSGGIETQPDDQADILMLGGPSGFTGAAAEAGVDDPGVGRGAAYGLLDGDGFPDVLVANIGSASRLYVPGCTDQRALIVDLRGTRSNRFGVGARLEAWSGDQVIYREVGNNVGWGGSAHPRAWFGLGAERADRLVIRWPSGAVQEIDPGDALRITVTEP